MKYLFQMSFLLVLCTLFMGCSLSSDEKEARVQVLKQSVENFIADAVQPNWEELFKLTDGSLENPEKLKNQIIKSWVPDATLTGGDIVSMAWVNDNTAKVKLTWSFQAGSVQSFSNETFVWSWKGNGWKYRGRALR